MINGIKLACITVITFFTSASCIRGIEKQRRDPLKNSCVVLFMTTSKTNDMFIKKGPVMLHLEKV